MAQERVERRLAAILAADMVGYSQLMEADEAGTLAQLAKLLTKGDIIVNDAIHADSRLVDSPNPET